MQRQIVDPLVRGILSAGIKMCWGFVVADVHMSHTGFLSSLELKRTVGRESLRCLRRIDCAGR